MASKPFDPTFKALVECGPADWPVLAGFPRAPTGIIDADIATVSGAADKVLRVRATPPYLLHLEFQSGHDSVRLPRSMHVRNTLLEDRHDLPVRSVAILLRPEADSPTLTGERTRAFPGEAPYTVFRYQVIRVWRLPPGPLLSGGLATLPLAPISAVTEAELPGIIEEMKARLARRSAGRFGQPLWASTYILMGLRFSDELAHELLQGVVSMEESVTYQAIIRKGKDLGAVDEARKMLLLQGSERFGPPDRRTGTALRRIGDVKRLEDLGVRLLRVTSWEELLEDVPTARQARQRPSTS